MTGDKKKDMEFCKKLLSEHPKIVEIMGLDREQATNPQIDPSTIKAIESVLAKGDRAE